jgi:hypothetical protein
MHCSRVDAFRHRAKPIIADIAAVSHACRGLTLTLSSREREDQNAWRATKVIRHGLCPILTCAREPVNPAAASFAMMSASL